METPGKKRSGILYLALMLFFAAVFVFSGIYLLDYYLESRQQQEDYRNLANIVASIQADNATATHSTQADPDTPPPASQPAGPQILPEYKALYAINNELVGWLKIEDTVINYPVLQSDLDNKDFYLDRDFYRQERLCGSIYVREECDVFTPSDNCVLFGHYMKDMTMFAGLDPYKEKSFWQTHQAFTFDTIYEHRTYQVIAVFKTSANVGEGFPYHRFVNAENEEEFNQFINTVKALAMYDTGLTAQYGDKLLCLSTCEYTLNNGRFIVVAKLVK